MIYYIHENIIKDALYNRKKEKLINNINEAYKQLKDIFSKMNRVNLAISMPSNKYIFSDANDPNYYIINNLLTKLHNYMKIINDKYSNDSDLLKLKQAIVTYLDKIAKSLHNYFSNNDIKIISNAMKEIVSEYNNNPTLRNKTIKSISSSYDGPEDPNKIKFICIKTSDSDNNNQLFRVLPKSLSKEFKSSCINVMSDMADMLYNKIKNNISNAKYINCDVWDSDEDDDFVVGCIMHD